MDQLIVVTQNARSLLNYKKRHNIINHLWFPIHGPKPHVLFLQETHSNASVEKLWSQEFQSRNTFFSHDSPTSGGLLTVIRSGLPFTVHTTLVTSSYIILHCSIATEDYVLVNVYYKPSPRHARESLLNWLNTLWKQVQKFSTHKILLGGDFNIRCEFSDKQYNQAEAGKLLLQFLLETELTDCWSLLHPEMIRYTYHGPHRSAPVASRIDYFFVAPLLLNYLHSCEIGVRYQSDHCPIAVHFLMHRNARGPGIFRFPNYLLGDTQFCTVVTDMIGNIVATCSDDSPSLLWDRVKLAIKDRTLEYVSELKSTLKQHKLLVAEVQELQSIVDEWIFLEGPIDELLEELERKTAELEGIERIVNTPKQISNVKRSQVFKDTCSKYFFKRVQGIPGSLRHMFNDDGDLVSTDREILAHCSQFYQRLFDQSHSPSCRLTNYSWQPEDKQLTEKQRHDLAQSVTKEDLEYALKYMKKGKSPGADGLTVEFYRRFWPVVGQLVIDSITHAQQVGFFTTYQRLGILKLLPKPRKDPRITKNLRPITLLNVDYKLFTKVLADRMKLVLPDIIHTDQNGFIKRRFLGNNILDLYALMAIAQERTNENDMVLLALDIEKAFDSVFWDYLAAVLWGFGFPQEFIDWVALTHQKAHIQILNNGWLSSSIIPYRGLPQGCGLSPLLFNLAVEGLATVIRRDQRIPGILIDQATKKIAQVADDTLLSFIGSTEVITRVKAVLDHFQKIQGSNSTMIKAVS